MKKKIITIALVFALLILATPVFGGSITKTISATYRNIQLVVNGVLVDLTDDNGSSMEPFIYNGRTYLPVAAVAKALDQQVSWDGATSTVYIGNVPGKVAKKMSLGSKSYSSISKDAYFDFSSQQIYCSSKSQSSVTYPLSGLATTIGGSYYVNPISGIGWGRGKLKIYGTNQELLYESTYSQNGIDPISFEVNVENELFVTIEFEHYDTSYATYHYIDEPYIVTTDY